MKILLVDDDRFVIASLVKNIDWKDLGFDEIFTAYNITDAKDIITYNHVDLLLSDIDMPNGNGLELLTWIRQNHDDMPVIFLTNYADFTYAQKALSLKSFHYFLKPIEFGKLTSIIKDATLQLTRQNNQLLQNCEAFWHSLLHDEISDDSEALRQYFIHAQLPYHGTDYFLPILFHLFPYTLTPDNKLDSPFSEHGAQVGYIKSAFKTVFIDRLTPVDVFIEYDAASARYLAIFQLDGPDIPSLLTMDCERFIQSVATETSCSLNALIGIPSPIGLFRTHFKELRAMAANCLDCMGRILHLSEYHPTFREQPSLDVETLELYLKNSQYSAFLDDCSRYLKGLSANNALYAASLNSFQIDVVQMLYTFYRKKGILANKLLHGDVYHTLSKNARNSIYDMNLYLQYIIHLTESYLSEQTSDKSIAKSVQDYIDLHYAEDISRNILTDIFYLDPDYASKLFKKELGISFKNYLIQKRIEVAKNLLANTDLPINIIADNVGYGNYSYFTRIFKKVTGITPIEYRNQISKTT
ncbi:MAG: response regulator [Blautia sp.]|nr:response regulator [Lachnoclostridium sp.]MCM1210741.1 response regulator [Blautia sp.]